MSLVPLTKIAPKAKMMEKKEEVVVVMPKLSNIFRRASMELQQITGAFGSRSQKRACALGAIRFYLGDNEDLQQLVHTLNSPEFVELRRQMDLLHDHLVKTYDASGIIGMNDGAKWSFTRFAEECEKLGI